ncbi:MAG: tRNA pseudouridine(55) synthase TruB [Clostridiales Family XIII bacterium]|jgi:tRNA pseudouridine55 synthase|nr:tRNA pseudouridine(55) synthase TruB [Clostridiales Family XIII bacterium]
MIAERKNGNPAGGILNVRKPAGMTSHDVVSFVRRLTGIKRVGHAGTLDPMATGVLVVCLGNATRIIEFMNVPGGSAKSYRCEMKLGFVSDTQDVWGEMTQCANPGNLPDERAVRDALKSMEGARIQSAPLYSAVKYKGKPLYAYARSGEPLPEEALKKRNVYIKSITVNYVDTATATAEFDIACSAGTYVRAVCHEVGAILGCGAVMSALVRMSDFGFRIEDSHTPEQLERMKDALPILPADSALLALPRAELDGSGAKRFQSGANVPFNENLGQPANGLGRIANGTGGEDGQFVRVYDDGWRLIGIGKRVGGVMKPCKVFARQSDETVR